MFRTLKYMFLIRFASMRNRIIYWCMHFPLIGKHIPVSFYSMKLIRWIVNFIGFVLTVLSALLMKVLFLALLVFVSGLYDGRHGVVFLEIVSLVTIVGAFMNTSVFYGDRDKYELLYLFHMDGKAVARALLVEDRLSYAIGYGLVSVFLAISGFISIVEAVMVTAGTVAIRCGVDALMTVLYEKKIRKTFKAPDMAYIIKGLICIALAFILPVFVVSSWIAWVVYGVALVVFVPSVLRLVHFDGWNRLLKQICSGFASSLVQVSQFGITSQQEKISNEDNYVSSLHGLAYLNDLFVHRHKKLLYGLSTKIAIGIAILFAGLIAAVLFFPGLGESFRTFPDELAGTMVFIVYAINSGTAVNSVLFVNCDRSLLTYSFFKRSDQILGLFRLRLKTMIRINLLPSLTMAIGFVLLALVSGGNLVSGLLLGVMVVTLSVFFSVHYLTLYYLIQPFNNAGKIVKPLYNIVVVVTYVVAYELIGVEVPLIVFSLGVILACVLYSFVATLLVLKCSAKRFRIR